MLQPGELTLEGKRQGRQIRDGIAGENACD